MAGDEVEDTLSLFFNISGLLEDDRAQGSCRISFVGIPVLPILPVLSAAGGDPCAGPPMRTRLRLRLYPPNARNRGLTLLRLL